MFRAIVKHLKHDIFHITMSNKQAIWSDVEIGLTYHTHLYVTLTNHLTFSMSDFRLSAEGKLQGWTGRVGSDLFEIFIAIILKKLTCLSSFI